MELAQQHLFAIKNRLTTVFNIRKFPATGSFGRGTSIRGGSDVDLMALISRKDFKWGDDLVTSATALQRIRRELLARYPTTPIHTDVNAVVVEFSQGASVDVVPAVFEGMLPNNWPLYQIPDGDGGWMPSCPEMHNKFIREADEQSRGKLRRVVQFVKHWRECRAQRVPISSFYIEMLLASEELHSVGKNYATCVMEAFQLIAQYECRALKDPLGIARYIRAVKSEAQRESALSSVRFARDQAEAACLADYAGDPNEAWKRWNTVFNNYFPR